MDNSNNRTTIVRQWEQNPEPRIPSKDPQVVLDCNIDGKAWLFDSMNECEAYLVYNGNTEDIVA